MSQNYVSQMLQVIWSLCALDLWGCLPPYLKLLQNECWILFGDVRYLLPTFCYNDGQDMTVLPDSAGFGSVHVRLSTHLFQALFQGSRSHYWEDYLENCLQ